MPKLRVASMARVALCRSGAHLILHLLERGKRIGVTSNSHNAIINLLHEVERFAVERGQAIVGLKKYGDADQKFESELDEPLITNSASNDDFNDDNFDLVAGTAWLFCREEMQESSTTSSSMRPARFRSPTRSRWRRPPTTSCSSVIRSTSPRSRRPSSAEL
jgi:hypothetical protein